jgi:hypothetical protein
MPAQRSLFFLGFLRTSDEFRARGMDILRICAK